MYDAKNRYFCKRYKTLHPIFCILNQSSEVSYKTILTMALPIMLSLAAQNVVNVTDTAFLGRLGEVELGASAIGGLVYIAIYMLGFGFATGAQILMARRNGENQLKELGSIANHAFVGLLVFAVFFLIVVLAFLDSFLNQFVKSDAIREACSTFLEYRMWGIVFAFLNACFRSFYVSITRTRALGYSSAIMAISNVILDYAMIFGHWGFPAMGIAGAAIASVISEAIAFAFFIVYTNRTLDVSKFGLFKFRNLKFSVINSTLNLSVWVMIQNFLSLGGWLAFFMIVEKTGERNLAVSNIARSIYLVLMIPIWAFATTINSLVSNSIGAVGHSQVFGIIKKVLLLNTSLVTIVAAFAVLFPETILSIYTSDAELIKASIPTFYIICGVMIPFAVAITLFQATTGTGNTITAMLIELITILLYLVYSWFFALQLHQPIHLVWTAEFFYFIIIGSLSYLYLKTGKWKNKVI